MNGEACLYPPVFVVFLPYLEQYEMTSKDIAILVRFWFEIDIWRSKLTYFTLRRTCKCLQHLLHKVMYCCYSHTHVLNLLKLFGKWKCFPVISIFPFLITLLFFFSQNTGEFCFFLWSTMKHSWISDAVTLSVTPCLDILVTLIYIFGRREAPLA